MTYSSLKKRRPPPQKKTNKKTNPHTRTQYQHEIPFLDVLIDTSNINKFTTSIHTKKKTFQILAPSIFIVNAPFVINEPS